MNPKLMVLGLAAALVVAFAVPAFGETTTVTPSVSQGLSVRALAKARLALLTARSAKSQSRVAVRTAQAATNTANEAKNAAKDGTEAKAIASATKGELDSTHVQSGFVAEAATTESESYVQLPGGPNVTVNVPPSGLIEVWAQVSFAGEGAVALFEDGQRMPGQSQECARGFASSALLAMGAFAPEPVALATPSSVTLPGGGGEFFCGVEGPPAGVLFHTSPGKHTYELRYQFSGCGCEPSVTFSNRLLRVAGRL